jgi:hypothetical protein
MTDVGDDNSLLNAKSGVGPQQNFISLSVFRRLADNAQQNTALSRSECKSINRYLSFSREQ